MKKEIIIKVENTEYDRHAIYSYLESLGFKWLSKNHLTKVIPSQIFSESKYFYLTLSADKKTVQWMESFRGEIKNSIILDKTTLFTLPDVLNELKFPYLQVSENLKVTLEGDQLILENSNFNPGVILDVKLFLNFYELYLSKVVTLYMFGVNDQYLLTKEQFLNIYYFITDNYSTKKQ